MRTTYTGVSIEAGRTQAFRELLPRRFRTESGAPQCRVRVITKCETPAAYGQRGSALVRILHNTRKRFGRHLLFTFERARLRIKAKANNARNHAAIETPVYLRRKQSFKSILYMEVQQKFKYTGVQIEARFWAFLAFALTLNRGHLSVNSHGHVIYLQFEYIIIRNIHE